MKHSFHIPVLGLAFSIDSPIKVAHFGISSVISIVDDELLERMRSYYCNLHNKAYQVISSIEEDARARRITAYLNLVHDIVQEQTNKLKAGSLATMVDLQKYFKLLPDSSETKKLFKKYEEESNPQSKKLLEQRLKDSIHPGDIDVNIMSKVDKNNFDKQNTPLAPHYSDASAALRGFVKSKLHSSLVISAGLNPRLFTYLAEFEEFLPNPQGYFNKKIILKVSDYRSALIQAKVLAKKGIWISEFRVESGLNCGGHAFATEGFLLGPILEEFRTKREDLQQELFTIYKNALATRGITLSFTPSIHITAQGGIGQANEQDFLIQHYKIYRTGWGSPFLLVPEATTVDENTMNTIANAEEKDFYISDASPLGVPFNNFRHSSAEAQRIERIQKGRPGAPCTKKYLISNTEFTEQPICTASRKYQHRKIKQLLSSEMSPENRQEEIDKVTAKTCLCEGLATSAYLTYDILKKKESPAVAICPGPNTAYFNKQYTLLQMVDHIYGRINILNPKKERPHMFINELMLYIEYLRKYIKMNTKALDLKKEKYIQNFKNKLEEGINYYHNLEELHNSMTTIQLKNFFKQLKDASKQLKLIAIR